MELKRLNIGNLIPGMQNVDIIGTIRRISTRDFSKDRGGEKISGSVCNILLGDETGSIKLTLWNEEIQKVEGLQTGDIIRVQGFVKNSNFGPELRVGKFGSIEKHGSAKQRNMINELAEGQVASIRAAIVQVFESNPFYEICPQCKASLKEDADSYICTKHGNVEPDYALHVTCMIDDGSGCIRAVFFKKNAEQILGMDAKKARDVVLRKGMDAVFKDAIQGEFVFNGNVKRNKFFDRIEILINKIEDVDVNKEIEMMMN